MFNNYIGSNNEFIFDQNKHGSASRQSRHVMSSRDQSNIEMVNGLRSQVDGQRLQFTDRHDDNYVVSNENTLHKAIIPFLVVSKFYGHFPLQNICAQKGSNLVFNWYSWGSAYALLRLAIPLSVIGFYGYIAIIQWEGLNHFITETTSNSFDSLIVWTTWTINHVVCFQIAINWPKFMKKWELMEGNTKQLGYHSHITLKIKMLSSIFIIIGIAIYTIIEIIITLLNITSTIRDLFIIILSYALSDKFRQLNQRLLNVQQPEVLRKAFWKETKKIYNILLVTTQEMDALLTTTILVSFASNLLQTCSCLVLLNNQKTTFGTYVHLYWFITLILRTCTVIHYAASINEQYKKIKVVLHSMSNQNDEAEVHIFGFLTMVSTYEVALTGSNFFLVTKNVLLTYFGSCFTFAVYRFQEANKTDMNNYCQICARTNNNVVINC